MTSVHGVGLVGLPVLMLAAPFHSQHANATNRPVRNLNNDIIVQCFFVMLKVSRPKAVIPDNFRS